MKKLYINCITAALLFMLLTNTGWGQVVIASEGFNNTTSLFSVSGGAYYTGNSGTNDGPANSPFAVEGTHSYGRTSGTATLITQDVNTIGFTNIQMSLRIAAFSLGSALNGLDADDYIKVEISPNGGTDFYNTIIIKGFSNAYWSYLYGTGVALVPYASHLIFSPNGGGERTSDGYSKITVTNLPSVENLRVKITIFNNSSNELWLIDDFKITSNPQNISEPIILMFSEYAEGSSNNKALEIYNGMTNEINLSAYVIALFANGTDRPTATAVLRLPDYILAPANTFVIVHTSSGTNFLSKADITDNTVMNFDGNDALAIYNFADVNIITKYINDNALEIDIFGKIGENPLSGYWGEDYYCITKDRTLRRKINVYSPVTSNPSYFYPAVEYDWYPQNTYDGFRIHYFGGIITTTKTIPKRAYTDLEINGSGISVTFNGGSLIKNSLTITTGRLKLGNNTLTVDGNVSVPSPGTSNMIVLDDGANLGTLKYRINNNGEYNFYIGDTRVTTEYSPAKVTFSGCTFDNAYLTIKMQNIKHPANTSNVNYINRYWIFEQTGINFGTSGYYDIELNYVLGDIIPFANQMYFGKYNGSFWENLGDADDANNKLIKTGLKSFSDFTGGTETGMPVKLSSFCSGVNGRNVNLKWTTEKEENNFGFDIERAVINGEQLKWDKIGFIQGKGNRSEPMNYSFEDRNLTSGKYKYQLKQVDYNGNFEYYELDNEVIIGVPEKFDLGQNYPNPFNPLTKINFDLPQKSIAKLIIYEITGKEIAVLVNENKDEGYHTVVFDAKNLASGIYFYRLYTGNFISTKKMVLIR